MRRQRYNNHGGMSSVSVSPRPTEDELEDAQWWSIDEVRAAIGRRHTEKPSGDRFLLLPPRVAIANQLIRSWVFRDASPSA
jgi:NADH pyrophosphatase NudC (nudix superfamily)